MHQSHHGLAQSGSIAAQAVIAYLRRHANAENMGGSSSPVAIAFLEIYRPGAIALSLLLFYIVSYSRNGLHVFRNVANHMPRYSN